MTWLLAVFFKMFALFAFLIFCAACNSLASRLPNGRVKSWLLRNY